MKFTPDYIFDSIFCITPEFFKSINVSCIVCDIDNTLVTYDDPIPTPEVAKWLHEMTDAGIKFAFVSNNEVTRAARFNESLGFACYGNAKKPLTKVVKRAVSDFGVDKKCVATLGDQIFTDVMAARFAGLGAAILVPPIKDLTNTFFKTKRVLERPLIKSYMKKHKEPTFKLESTVWDKKKK